METVKNFFYGIWDASAAFTEERPMEAVLIALGVLVVLLIALLLLSRRKPDEQELEEGSELAATRREAIEEGKAAEPERKPATVGADGELVFSPGVTVNERFRPQADGPREVSAQSVASDILRLTDDFDTLMDRLEEQLEEKEAQIREREQKLERLERSARALDENIDVLEDEQEELQEEAEAAKPNPYPALFWVTLAVLAIETGAVAAYYFTVLAK